METPRNPKQKRAPKILFGQDDKALLVECALKEKEILENKRTDNYSSAKKNEAWVRIAEDFNATTSGAVRISSGLCIYLCF